LRTVKPLKLSLWLLLSILIVGVDAAFSVTPAQDELAATFTVQSGVAEQRRIGTRNWLPVRSAGILGVGDVLRTGEQGITVVRFADAAVMRLDPDTEITLLSYTSVNDAQRIGIEQRRGQIVAQVSPRQRLTVQSLTSEVISGGGRFAVRRAVDGQLAILSLEREVTLSLPIGGIAILSEGRGARIESEGDLSEIVGATAFPQLDAYLDGCTANIVVSENRRLPVYLAPSLDSEGIGIANPYIVPRLYGRVTGTNWYRLRFAGAFAWVQIDLVRLGDAETGCVGLRPFDTDHTEDIGRYTSTLDPEAWGYCTGTLAAPEGWRSYRVVEDETLFELQQRTGTPAIRLQTVNCIADPTFIIAGSRLSIP
jgi:hypothetical protein